jgi:hypothetical protein
MKASVSGEVDGNLQNTLALETSPESGDDKLWMPSTSRVETIQIISSPGFIRPTRSSKSTPLKYPIDVTESTAVVDDNQPLLLTGVFVPSTIVHNGTSYPVTAVGPTAFHLNAHISSVKFPADWQIPTRTAWREHPFAD